LLIDLISFAETTVRLTDTIDHPPGISPATQPPILSPVTAPRTTFYAIYRKNDDGDKNVRGDGGRTQLRNGPI